MKTESQKRAVQGEIIAPPENRKSEVSGAREIGAPPESRMPEEGGARRDESTA